MAGRGPIPKLAALRQRRNRRPGAATLPSQAETAANPVPDLPPRDRAAEVWHPQVLAWWQTVWRSPMAVEYLASDRAALDLLAELHQQRWTTSDPKALVKLSAEIRHQEARFGLSPTDRARLQWTIEVAEAAEERGTQRKQRKATPLDPRDVLRVVK